jgi:hypothetical protein
MDLLLKGYNVSNLADGNRRGWISDDHPRRDRPLVCVRFLGPRPGLFTNS